MNREEWQKIQQNWDYLRRELKVEYILDILTSSRDKVLTEEDEQRVKCEYVDADKNEKLLRILKKKPENVHAYKNFLQALEKEQSHIFERLNTTTVDQSLLQDSPHDDITSMVREILLENFVDTPGETCSLPDIKEAVRALHYQGIDFDWKDDKLRKFVTEVFTGITFEPGSRKKKPKFLNLGVKKKEEEKSERVEISSSFTAGTECSAEGQSSSVSKLQTMDADELCKCLGPVIKDLGIPENILSQFREMEIDGLVFLRMEEKHLEKYFPEISFGKRMRLMVARENLEQQFVTEPEQRTMTVDPASLTPRATEFFRTFDTPVDATDRYRKGSIIALAGFTRENMIHPIRKCISMNTISQSNIYKSIAIETVKFAAACLNDRTNGTIYAGINERDTSECHEGEVVGISINRTECEKVLRKLISQAFYEDQHEIVFRAIRSAKFVRVDELNSAPSRFVVEVDIVPHARLVGEELFFVRSNVLRGPKEKRGIVYRFIDGSLRSLTEKEIHEYSKKKQSLTALRAEQELRSSDAYIQPDLRKQILNLYTGGSETVEDDIQPVVLMSPLDEHMDKDYIKETFTFFQYFDAEAIFDFELKNERNGIYSFLADECEEVFELLTTDNFERKHADFSTERLELLKTTHQKLWIFSNGYTGLNKPALNAFDWKQERLDGFKEALRLFKIPQSRAMVLIFLFSKNYDVLLEASAEILMTFRDQWMLLAENKDIARSWKDEMVRRNVASKETLQHRCVLGMPWRHVNATFKQIMGPIQTFDCEIPTSTGAFCILPKRELNSMTDLEVLSRNIFDNDEEMRNSAIREDRRKRAEERFYSGNQVEWLNFWFKSDHVLKRKQHAPLKEMVKKALDSPRHDDDERIGLVTLLHQRGAGGTTSSRQILWDLRAEHRCCVVRQITDQTADQITYLRNYEETSKKRPPLILIDNMDEESVSSLLLRLEKLAKIASREEEYFPVFCAVLLCERRVNLPFSLDGNKVLLKHDLEPWELSFLDKKNRTLADNHEKNDDVNPALLISFNILRKNFDIRYIKKIVEDLMKELDDLEVCIIKYLSVINTYDVFFHQIAVPCFDPIAETPLHGRRLVQFGLTEFPKSRRKCWEANMSASMRLLVNKASQKKIHGTKIGTIRITSVLLAQEILHYVEKHRKETKSSIVMEILSSPILDSENSSTDELLGILSNLVKKRRIEKDGKQKLSPLILDISKEEGIERAAEIFTEVFKKTNDPMVAQQIGRFYMIHHNWIQAEKFARKATELLPQNSFVLDTLGHVYKNQVYEFSKTAKDTQSKIRAEDAAKVLKLAHEAILIFRREQHLSETERTFMNNHSGYLNEVRTIFTLCGTMCYFEGFPGEESFHRFLVDMDFVPKSFSFIDKEAVSLLKSLGESAFKTIRRLEEELVQMKGDSREELCTDRFFDHETLTILKENANTFFGEDSNVVPEFLRPEDACNYRRRRVKRIGLTSVHGALALKDTEDGEEKLLTAYSMMYANVCSQWCSAFDLVTILNVVVSLHLCSSRRTEMFSFQDILNWSKQLYHCRQPTDRTYLETFVYLVLFHLPTDARLTAGYDLCSDVTLKEALNRWRETFLSNHPKQRDQDRLGAKKGTTLFFLGKGNGLSEVVYQKDLHINGVKFRDTEFWQSKLARQKFQRLEGTLLNGGKEVYVPLKTTGGSSYYISISTSKPVRSPNMWQKKVYFVFGFGWSGPKAYDICLDDPTEERELDVIPKREQDSPRLHQKQLDVVASIPLNLGDIENEMKATKKILESLKLKQRLNKKQRDQKRRLQAKLEELSAAKDRLLGDG